MFPPVKRIFPKKETQVNNPGFLQPQTGVSTTSRSVSDWRTQPAAGQPTAEQKTAQPTAEK